MTRRAALFLLLVVAAAAGLFVLLGRDALSTQGPVAATRPVPTSPAKGGALELEPFLSRRASSTPDAAGDPATGRSSRPLPLAPTRIEGRVTHQDGTVAANVRVRAEGRDRETDDEVLLSETDAQGFYRFDEPPPGSWRIVVRGGGWVAVGLVDSADDEAPHDKLVAIVNRGAVTRMDIVLQPAARIVGRIQDGRGTGLSAAEVIAFAAPSAASSSFLDSYVSPPRCEVTQSDALGNYELAGLIPGTTYIVVARALDLVAAHSMAVNAALERSQRVDLTLEAGRWIDVSVVTQAGQPIRRARVWAYAADTGWIDLLSWSGSMNAPEGRVRVGPLRAASVSVGARAPGYLDGVGTMDPGVEVPVGTDAVEVRLVPGGSVSGCVVGPDDKPVGGVSVQAQQRETREDGFSVIGFDSAWTKPDGSFRIDGLPAGTLTLVAELREVDVPMRTLLEVQSGATDVLVRLAPDPLHVVLRIVGPDGSPVPQATVHHSPMVPQEARGGRFDIASMHVEHWDLEVTVDDARDSAGASLHLAPAKLTLPAGKGGEVLVRLEPACSLAGVVVDEQGQGIAGVVILSEQAAIQALTQADGSFRVSSLPPGSYRLQVVPPEPFLGLTVRDVRGGREDLRYTLQRGLRPRITILDGEGQPVPGANAFLEQDEPPESRDQDLLDLAWNLDLGVSSREPSDDKGLLVLPTVPIGARYALRVAPPTDRKDLRDLRLSSWIPEDATLRLPRAWSVSGVVRDLEGRPLEDAPVLALDADGNRTWARTNDQGWFEVQRLAEGVVRLAAAAEGPLDPKTGPWVEVQAGATDAALVADRGLTLTVFVEDLPEGVERLSAALLPDASDAKGSSEAPEPIGGLYLGGGRLRFRTLRPNQGYTLWIAPIDDASDLSLWAPGVRHGPGELRVRLVPGKTIRIQLQGMPATTEINGYDVTRSGVGASSVCSTGKDGSFEVRGLPEGRWTVRGYAMDPESGTWRGTGEVEAGESVQIQLLPPKPPGR